MPATLSPCHVGPYRLKSAPAKATRKVHGDTSKYRVIGVAWGGPIARVEVSIDGGPWRQARVIVPDSHGGPSKALAWNFWTYDWGQAPLGTTPWLPAPSTLTEPCSRHPTTRSS